MKTKTNFMSIVVIGGFNPMILTPEFLSENCGFKSEHEPAGKTTPVLTEIAFGGVNFRMELNRFQIITSADSGFHDSLAVDMMMKYLEILKFTPVVVAGLNFNFTISDFDLSGLRKVALDPDSMGGILGLKPSSFSLSASDTGVGLTVDSVSIGHRVDDDIDGTVKLDFTESEVIVNDNFEIDRLDTNRNRIQILKERHDHFLALNKSIQVCFERPR